MRTPGSKVAVPQPPGTPAAQIRHFVVDGKRWMLYDMKVGFQGAYSLKGNVATLTTTLKAVKGKGTQAMVFDVSKDRKTLTGRPAKGLPTVLQFVWKTPGVFVRMPK